MSDNKDIQVKGEENKTEAVKEETAADTAVKAPAAKEAAKPSDKKAKKAVKKEKKPNIFIRIWKKLKEIVSELKKVTWPTFPTVLKQTGVVIAVVVFFMIIIFGFDSLLSFLYKLMFPVIE
jgi:preprotein translocase subunit SecE